MAPQFPFSVSCSLNKEDTSQNVLMRVHRAFYRLVLGDSGPGRLLFCNPKLELRQHCNSPLSSGAVAPMLCGAGGCLLAQGCPGPALRGRSAPTRASSGVHRSPPVPLKPYSDDFQEHEGTQGTTGTCSWRPRPTPSTAYPGCASSEEAAQSLLRA